MPSIKVKRGSLAQLNAAATALQLKQGEVYLITDQNRLAVGLSASTYSMLALTSEIGGSATDVAEMTSTQTSSVVALANITQLVLPVLANSLYKIEAFVTFQSAATTTGLNLGLTTPAASRNMVEIVVPIASTAVASALRTFFPNAAIAQNAGNVLGTGVTAINSNHTAKISGLIKTGANAGNCQITFASEIAASAVTLQIGSMLTLQKIG